MGQKNLRMALQENLRIRTLSLVIYAVLQDEKTLRTPQERNCQVLNLENLEPEYQLIRSFLCLNFLKHDRQDPNAFRTIKLQRIS